MRRRRTGRRVARRANRAPARSPRWTPHRRWSRNPEALKVHEWRHKLQKTFLSSNKSLPKEDEMPAVDTLFTTVEGYLNMNIDYLTFSKIGKVMRHINLLGAQGPAGRRIQVPGPREGAGG
ncbi:hypothetical protein B0H11DRAFT_866205 [Mycena galericulata]|nr:hypothetical protein B0H11DRAFT_866205 [Mycena galericulata]